MCGHVRTWLRFIRILHGLPQDNATEPHRSKTAQRRHQTQSRRPRVLLVGVQKTHHTNDPLFFCVGHACVPCGRTAAPGFTCFFCFWARRLIGGGYPRRGQLLFFVRWGEAVPRVANARDPGEKCSFFCFLARLEGGTWSGPQSPPSSTRLQLSDVPG